jgi:hypothetical protein
LATTEGRREKGGVARDLKVVGDDRHGVSTNASETEPTRLLAVFMVDRTETELTIAFGE